jgi:hypothetical protein
MHSLVVRSECVPVSGAPPLWRVSVCARGRTVGEWVEASERRAFEQLHTFLRKSATRAPPPARPVVLGDDTLFAL